MKYSFDIAHPSSKMAVSRPDALQMFFKNNRGFNIMNPGSVGQSQRSPLWYQRHGGNGSAKPPGAANPPSTPTAPPQWTFQPNPLDQPPTGAQPPAGQPPTGAQPPAGQPPAPGNAGQAQGQNPWSVAPPIQPWMFNPMGGGWGQWGGWQYPGFNQQQPPGMPPQTGGGLPPYNPQTGGQLPPYSGNISNTVPTMQPSSPYSGQPWRQL